MKNCSHKPKVLVVNKLFLPWIGGVERVVADQVEELRDRVEFGILVCQPKGRGTCSTWHGVPVEYCRSFGMVRSMPVSTQFFARFRDLAPKYDLVHFHEPVPFGAFTGSIFGFNKAVVTLHSGVERQRILRNLYLPFLAKLMDRATFIMPTSDRLAERVPLLKRFSSKTRVVHLGIDDSELMAAASRKKDIANLKQLAGGRAIFLSVGRMVPYKGFDVLLKGIAAVQEAFLFLVGQGPLRYGLQQQATRLGILNRVVFAGEISQEDLGLYYHACDCFVLPSLGASEAFGLVQLEAMACGKPVINTDLPTGVPFVSVHESTGLTVTPGDPGQLASAIRRMVNDESARTLMGITARIRYEQLFRRRRMADQLLQVYKDSLET
jgi:glycosyltransferase involved in cell wall biosynthesis